MHDIARHTLPYAPLMVAAARVLFYAVLFGGCLVCIRESWREQVAKRQRADADLRREVRRAA